MRINVLGPMTVVLDGEHRVVRAGKVRAMLAALAMDAGHAVSHHDLVEELWPNRHLRNPRNALQAHATRIRKVLDRPDTGLSASTLKAVPNGYLLDAPPERVDARAFMLLVADSRPLLLSSPDRAVPRLESALALWRGPALLDAGDGLRCRSAAALLEEHRLAAHGELAIARMALGDDLRAIAELRPQVARNPLNEHLCEALMLALYRTGQQADALALFRHTRQSLGGELGIEPGTRLRLLQSGILRHDPALFTSAALRRLHGNAADRALR